MAGGPFDYIVPAAQQNPFGTALQGFALGQQVRQQQEQAQLAQQQLRAQMDLQRKYQTDASALLNNPNAGARDFAAFQLKYPQFKDATKGAFDALSADQQANRVAVGGRIYSALNAGRKDLALSILDDQIKAGENSGANPQELNALRGNRQLIDTLPIEQARNAAGMYLSTIADPKQSASFFGQLGTEQRAQESQPFKVQQERGRAQQELAEGAARPAKLQAELDNVRSQIAERTERLGLDRDKFNLDFDAKLAELQGKQAVKLSAGMEKTQADSVGAAGVADQASTNALQLADKFKNDAPSSGVYGKGKELWKRVFGSENEITALRKQYIALKNSAALGLLPPGPATDRDISRIDAGFLSETADAKEIEDWLRSYANVQKAVAARENAKADWISEVGNTGKATRDIEVNGIKVPAGTSFNDFVQRGLKPAQQPATPGAGPAAAPAAGPRYLNPSLWDSNTTVSSQATTVG